MSVIVLAEHNGQTLNQDATAKAVTAAKAFGMPVHILCAGEGCQGIAGAAAKLSGVEKVLCASDPALGHAMAEPIAKLMAGLSYQVMLSPATSNGKNIMARVAGLLDVMVLTDVMEIKAPDTFVRPIYAGNAIQTVKSRDAIKVLTVRTTVFDATPSSESSAPVEELTVSDLPTLSSWSEDIIVEADRPELTSAKVVISGGRGLGSKENFAQIEQLADILGAAIGASRAAVDAGYAPNDYQVGQTGKVVAPDLYIAVGISGAIQHLAGMKDSKVIVAINKDPEAPIFKVSDYGLVADLFDALPKLREQLQS
jgi:electron transfer flavoprotein alpha subunit